MQKRNLRLERTMTIDESDLAIVARAIALRCPAPDDDAARATTVATMALRHTVGSSAPMWRRQRLLSALPAGRLASRRDSPDSRYARSSPLRVKQRLPLRERAAQASLSSTPLSPPLPACATAFTMSLPPRRAPREAQPEQSPAHPAAVLSPAPLFRSPMARGNRANRSLAPPSPAERGGLGGEVAPDTHSCSSTCGRIRLPRSRFP